MPSAFTANLKYPGQLICIFSRFLARKMSKLWKYMRKYPPRPVSGWFPFTDFLWIFLSSALIHPNPTLISRPTSVRSSSGSASDIWCQGLQNRQALWPHFLRDWTRSRWKHVEVQRENRGKKSTGECQGPWFLHVLPENTPHRITYLNK